MQPLVRDNIRLAATVMLVRDGANGLEVYMVQRPGRGDFPDLHVFPGGKVDESDYAPELCHGLDDPKANELMGLEAGALRYWVAVARECYEECGVLIARSGAGLLSFDDHAVEREYLDKRESLLAGSFGFSELCSRDGLAIECDSLAYFSHWITPEMAPRRFDTRFFMAAMPSDQATLAHTSETADDTWIEPRVALQNFADGDWLMIDPTLRSLETLSQFGSVQEALTTVRAGTHLMPWTEELGRQGMQRLR